MTYEDDIKKYTKSINITNTQSHMFNDRIALALFNQMESLANQAGHAYNPERMSKSVAIDQYQKAITGATDATGAALVGQRFNPAALSNVAIELGNAFVESGITYIPEAAGQVTIPAWHGFGEFVESTPGSTPAGQDIAQNPGINNPIPLVRYQATIPVYTQPALNAYLHNRGQLLRVFEEVMEIKKGVLADKIVAEAVLNPTPVGGITARPVSTETYFPITQEVVALTSEFAQYGSPKIYVNSQGLDAIIREQNSQGDLNNLGRSFPGAFIYSNERGAKPRKGLVGYISGYEVHLVPSIPSVLTVDASNAVTALTGGDRTAVIVALPQWLGLQRGKAEDDYIAQYDPRNDLTAHNTAVLTIGASTNMGSNVINGYGVGYYAFQA